MRFTANGICITEQEVVVVKNDKSLQALWGKIKSYGVVNKNEVSISDNAYLNFISCLKKFNADKTLKKVLLLEFLIIINKNTEIRISSLHKIKPSERVLIENEVMRLRSEIAEVVLDSFDNGEIILPYYTIYGVLTDWIDVKALLPMPQLVHQPVSVNENNASENNSKISSIYSKIDQELSKPDLDPEDREQYEKMLKDMAFTQSIAKDIAEIDKMLSQPIERIENNVNNPINNPFEKLNFLKNDKAYEIVVFPQQDIVMFCIFASNINYNAFKEFLLTSDPIDSPICHDNTRNQILLDRTALKNKISSLPRAIAKEINSKIDAKINQAKDSDGIINFENDNYKITIIVEESLLAVTFKKEIECINMHAWVTKNQPLHLLSGLNNQIVDSQSAFMELLNKMPAQLSDELATAIEDTFKQLAKPVKKRDSCLVM